MRRDLAVLLSCLALLAAATAAAQQPHWYVLLEPGNERWYRGRDGHDFHELVTGYDAEGNSVVARTHYYQGEFFDFEEQRWHIAPDGDVWLGETCYLDFPLEPGKSWGRRWGEHEQYYDLFSIVGFEDTWAPDCVVVREAMNVDGWVEFIIVRWYADGVGLVHWEMSCAFCSYSLEPVVVPGATVSWGDLKARWRGAGR